MDIEKEVQARVEFKMNEILTAVENTAKVNWELSFSNNSQKHCYYWEAFQKMKNMFIKEMEIMTPYDNMSEQKIRKKRDKAIDQIMERFCKRGEKDYHQNEKFLVNIIENLQSN